MDNHCKQNKAISYGIGILMIGATIPMMKPREVKGKRVYLHSAGFKIE